MAHRILLIGHGVTAATRRAAFPLDESLEPPDDRQRAALDALRQRLSAGPARPSARHTARLVRGTARRCAQTAEALGLDCAPDPALDDWDLGDWAGRTLDAVTAERPDAATAEPLDAVAAWLRDPGARPHGGETLAALLARAASWLDDQADRPETRTIALSHPAVLRAVAVHALQAPPHSFWRLDAGPLATLTLTGRPPAWSVRLPTG